MPKLHRIVNASDERAEVGDARMIMRPPAGRTKVPVHITRAGFHSAFAPQATH